MAYVVSFILTIVYSLRMKKVFKKVKINLECNDKRCIFAVLFNQNTWRQPQDVNQGVKEEKSSKKIKINFADKKKVLTFATRFGKTEVWNKRRVFITRKFWKFFLKYCCREQGTRASPAGATFRLWGGSERAVTQSSARRYKNGSSLKRLEKYKQVPRKLVK